MSQLIVPRALSKLPLFDLLRAEGDRTRSTVYCYYNSSGLRTLNLNMCPYVDLIPFHYLQVGYSSGTRNIEQINRTYHGSLAEARKALNKYLFYNRMEPVQVYYSSRSGAEMVGHCFYGDAGPRRLGAGGSYYTVTQFGVYIEREQKMYPAALLVIPRENWLLCKMQLMKTGYIDFSHCVMLIDQELDTTRYHNQGFRSRIFRGEILPAIAKMNVAVAKVPLSYMMEKCFVPEFAFLSKNIFDRRKEEDEAKKILLSMLKRQLLGDRPDVGSSAEELAAELGNIVMGEGITTTNVTSDNWVITTSTAGGTPEGGTITWGTSTDYSLSADEDIPIEDSMEEYVNDGPQMAEE